MYVRPHFEGHFEKGGSANQARRTALKIYQKIANSCIWGPTMQADLDKWGCQPIGPNRTNFDF